MYTKALVENGRLRGKEVYKKSDKTESEEVIMAKEVRQELRSVLLSARILTHSPLVTPPPTPGHEGFRRD